MSWKWKQKQQEQLNEQKWEAWKGKLELSSASNLPLSSVPFVSDLIAYAQESGVEVVSQMGTVTIAPSVSSDAFSDFINSKPSFSGSVTFTGLPGHEETMKNALWETAASAPIKDDPMYEKVLDLLIAAIHPLELALVREHVALHEANHPRPQARDELENKEVTVTYYNDRYCDNGQAERWFERALELTL